MLANAASATEGLVKVFSRQYTKIYFQRVDCDSHSQSAQEAQVCMYVCMCVRMYVIRNKPHLGNIFFNFFTHVITFTQMSV
jgi:hypothetical protein